MTWQYAWLKLLMPFNLINHSIPCLQFCSLPLLLPLAMLVTGTGAYLLIMSAQPGALKCHVM